MHYNIYSPTCWFYQTTKLLSCQAARLEHFSIECCKTNRKIIPTANQKRGNTSKSQWELKVKLTKLHESAGKRQRPNRDWSWFCIWLVKRVVQVFWTNKGAKLRKTFDTQLTIAPILIYLHFGRLLFLTKNKTTTC